MRKRTASRAHAVIVMLIAGIVLSPGAKAQAPAEPQKPAQAPASAKAEVAQPALVPQETPAASPGAVAFDVLVLRPFGLIMLPIGVAGFIPAALTTAPNGMESVQTALELFVTNPANFVFRRKLGDF